MATPLVQTEAVKRLSGACRVSRRKLGPDTGVPSHALVDHRPNPPLNLRHRQGFRFSARRFPPVKEQSAVDLSRSLKMILPRNSPGIFTPNPGPRIRITGVVPDRVTTDGPDSYPR